MNDFLNYLIRKINSKFL